MKLEMNVLFLWGNPTKTLGWSRLFRVRAETCDMTSGSPWLWLGSLWSRPSLPSQSSRLASSVCAMELSHTLSHGKSWLGPDL